MSRYIIDLRSRAAGDARVSGGKGAGLNRLARWGFNVPPGFVITTRALRDFIAALDVDGNDHDATREEREGLAAAVRSGSVPAGIRSDVLRAYGRLGGRMAVRSSAVSEDGAAASHAGQFDTCLNIEGEAALLAALRDCWASMFAGRADSYLGGRGLVQDGMAVVVQRMAPAIAGGVAFTADPISGQPCIVVEAAAGLGAGVVGGVERADRYVVDNRGVLAEVAPAVAGRPVLGQDAVLTLARIAREIEQRAGRPQDIEWAWDGAAFHVLQARPITTLRDRHVYSSRVVSDMAPGLVKPMVYDVNTLATVREIFGTLFATLLGAHHVDTSRFVARLYSRVYADTTVLGAKLAEAGLPPNLFEMMLRDERSGSGRMRMTMQPRLLGVTARMVSLAVRAGRLDGRQDRKAAEGALALEAFRRRDWSAVPLPDLLAELDRLIALRDGLSWFYFCCVFSAAARTRLLRGWVERKAPHVAFGDLLRGLAGLKSLEPSLELKRLAEHAGGLDADAAAALCEAEDDRLRRLLPDSPEGQAFLAEVDVFLARHGYLSSNGSDFSSPSWIENPALIWRSIGRSITAEAGAPDAQAGEIREAAVAAVRTAVGPVDRRIFGGLLTAATTAIDLRERSSALLSQYTYEMRRLFVAVGERLAASDRLAQPDDLFYLAYREMQDLAAGRLAAGELAACIAGRRAEMAADAAVDPPDMIAGTPGQVFRAAPTAERLQDVEYLSGIGGSPGLVRGIARVVSDPAHAPLALGRTDILVVPFSDVGWTPLFSGIGGIVAETGGQLSHAAIVAREYNLPAVVGVRDATRRIPDGQPVTVDGNRGRVYLEPAGP